MRKKIITIVGARPQFVKAAAVSRVLRTAEGLQEVLVHTGQHYDYAMSDIFFEELSIPRPDYNLHVGSGLHGEQTAAMLKGIEEILIKERPAAVMVYGDTNSTLSGALAASKLHIPVAHVEAGLRSFNRRMPEEINRVLTDHLSQWLFVPTSQAAANLAREGVSSSGVYTTGDVMYDAVLFYAERTREEDLSKLGIPATDFILATVHRAENTDDGSRLLSIFNALREISLSHPVVVPLHPRTLKLLQGLGWQNDASRLQLIEPVGYLTMLALQQRSALVITDSGGLQKEAYFLGKHCLTLRNETEWVELVEHGFNDLVSDITHLPALVQSRYKRAVDSGACLLYGDGKSGQKITEILTASLRD